MKKCKRILSIVLTLAMAVTLVATPVYADSNTSTVTTGTGSIYKDVDTITLDDGTEVVVSNQWGKDNIKAFVVLAKSFGYKIQEI